MLEAGIELQGDQTVEQPTTEEKAKEGTQDTGTVLPSVGFCVWVAEKEQDCVDVDNGLHCTYMGNDFYYFEFPDLPMLQALIEGTSHVLGAGLTPVRFTGEIFDRKTWMSRSPQLQSVHYSNCWLDASAYYTEFVGNEKVIQDYNHAYLSLRLKEYRCLISNAFGNLIPKS